MKDNDDLNIFDDDLEEDFRIISVINDLGETEEFIVLDSVNHEGKNYILVVYANDEENDEIDAQILKETKEDGEESVFEIVTDEAELNEISLLFEGNDDYEISL